MERQLQSDKMRDTGIVKLLIGMSLPAIASMLVQSLYNVVDSIFVARYSPYALEALSIVFPMQQLIIAFAVGVGVGTNAYVSRKLGQGKREEANLAAQTGLFVALATGVCFIILGWFAAKPFVGYYTDNPLTLSYGVTYLRLVTCLSMGCFVDVLCSKVLQSTGNMKIPMLTQLLGAIVNIVLDPIFIFVCGWGVTGAAVATIIGQLCAMTAGLCAFRFIKQDVNVFFNKNFRLKKEIILGIARIGIPVTIMNAVAGVVTTILNGILKIYENAITVMGIFFKLQSFVFMPVFGLSQGALPILSYNFGAKRKDRFIECYKWSVVFSLAIMAVGTAIFHALPMQLLSLFDAQGGTVAMGIKALRIASLCFIPAAYGIASSNMLQALRMGFVSMIISLLRQLLLLVPFAFLFSYLWGVNGVWYSYPASEIIVTILLIIVSGPLINKKFALFTEEPALRCEEGK